MPRTHACSSAAAIVQSESHSPSCFKKPREILPSPNSKIRVAAAATARTRTHSSQSSCPHDRFLIVSPRSLCLPPDSSSIWPALLNWVWRLLPFPSGFSQSAHPHGASKKLLQGQSSSLRFYIVSSHSLCSSPDSSSILLPSLNWVSRLLVFLSGFFQWARLHGGSKKLLQESSSSLRFYIFSPHSRCDPSNVLLAPLLQEFRFAG